MIRAFQQTDAGQPRDKLLLLILLGFGLLPGLAWPLSPRAEAGEPLRRAWQAPELGETGKRPRIIGGEALKHNIHPWMAALVYSGIPLPTGQYCAASLIHPRWLLTAAHCMIGESVSTIKVLPGHHQLSLAEKGDLLDLDRVVIHPQFNRGTLVGDIALLRLARPTDYPPVKLIPAYGRPTREGEIGLILGWGRYSLSPVLYAETLHQAWVPLVSNETCNRPESYDGEIFQDMLCAGRAEGGVDSCVGDSGGPLLISDWRGGWWQAGIISSGEGCGLPNYYGVYTRISVYREFIQAHACQPQDIPAAPRLELNIKPPRVTLNWPALPGVQGYRLYYLPCGLPETADILDRVISLDLGSETTLSVNLTSGNCFHVAARAYRHVCDSPFSNLLTVYLP